MKNFCHLHCHTHYSLLDGASQIKPLVSRAKELGMTSLAITDHGNLHGALKFYQECKRQDVNPIIGYEAYIVGDHREKDDSNYHLTVLAKNRTGYSNLLRLASRAYLEGFYRKPRISYDLLEEFREGLVVLSGCMSSEFARKLDQDEWLKHYVHRMVGMFGDDFSIELQRNGMEAQEQITRATIEFATRNGLPMVATADCHYVRQEDAEAQDTLLCVNTGSKRCSHDRMRMDGNQYYLRSPEEMYDQFQDQPEAVLRSHQIAQSVEIELDLGVRHFPVFAVGSEKPQDTLARIVSEGLASRLPEAGPEYLARIESELRVIHDLGFDEYFLIIWDFVKWARERGIFSSARGSGVGSLVCYCLYISHVDPIEYGLLFERFLSYSRREAPDIDVDFEKERRAEVMWYVKQKYGEDCVAQIGTFGTMGPKSAINDVARAYGYPQELTKVITGLIPDDPFHELADTFDNPEFDRIHKENPQAAEVIDMALRLEGTARSLGTHAAAVVIADRPLVDYVPLAKVAGKSDVITQWDMHDVEDAGLMKMDFLGLRNMTILSEVVRTIEETHGLRIDLMKIPFDDQKTFDLLARGETKGVFQLESPGMTETLVRMKPDCVADINACIALYRPGPLDAGMIDTYIKRKHGDEPVDYPHPSVSSVLEETYGVMVYQEQVMLVVHELGGVPLDESYSCVKAISKKIPEKMATYREGFVGGCRDLGIDGGKLWKQIETFARYGFNKSHSTAYAFIGYWTAWFKANYPVEFMAALLNADLPGRNFARKDKLVEHLEDCQRMGITVQRPDVNLGGSRFRVRGNQILFGLQAVKGVSRAAGDAIEKHRGDRPYDSLLDLYTRVSKSEVPKATTRNLIRAGACDSFAVSREVAEDALDRAIKLGAGDYKRPERVKLYKDLAADKDQRLKFEKEFLGFYLSGHPADEHTDLWSAYCTCSPSTFTQVTPGKMVVIGGMVNSIRNGYTKNDKPYISFTIENSEGVIDCIMWSDMVKKYKWISNGLMFFVKGRVDTRGSRRSLTVKEIVRPGEQDWNVSFKVSNITVEELFQISGGFAGEHELLWYKDDVHARLKSRVRACGELVDNLRNAGATVEVLYR